ncbi:MULTISPECIES: hypothetical protein [unclassified Bradyrhizobium]|uniref:hypothetical protein n=1 Tax=unclassified Bradyrhizobium TaxID=2631580 RepID=UPI001BA66709|nr:MULTISPECIES: hypothetical protein [unclassified Bradyrhizobium]MBR1228253.1 hypothetical protein [Bradyrhizobium sp. AUGA SZCCT0176]MBR1230468.1 hypothetical protein [Bradyrhizobium sp. AUGA SZCCT0182]MBR1284880.1 hypothetical protein [Bradyrhizobium sp. AUGA SZCCT0177]MBR1299308.1 hypothetical protein [Bradyrhizobium sp. AUGA SZCCT0042]
MTQTSKSINGNQRTLDERVLKDGELEAVSGGAMFGSAFSEALKSIGEGLTTMARKG